MFASHASASVGLTEALCWLSALRDRFLQQALLLSSGGGAAVQGTDIVPRANGRSRTAPAQFNPCRTLMTWRTSKKFICSSYPVFSMCCFTISEYFQNVLHAGPQGFGHLKSPFVSYLHQFQTLVRLCEKQLDCCLQDYTHVVFRALV